MSRACALAVLLLLLFASPLIAGGTRDAARDTAPEASLPAPPGGASSGYPLTVRDDSGTVVSLRSRPTRIVSLATHTDDILVDLVDHSRLLGVTAFAADPAISNVAQRVADVAHRLTLNVEVILALQADLVFVALWSETDKVAQLRRAGVPVFVTRSPLEPDEVAAAIRTVARLVGESARGEQIVERMNRRLEAVWDKVGPLPASRRLRVLDYATWGAAMGAGSSWDQLVRRAGLVNAAGGLAADSWGQVPLSKEKILELDPDILILPGWVYGDSAASAAFLRQIVEDPALSALRAIRQRRVYRLPEGLKGATSQYVADAVEHLARLAYPELFP